MGSADDSSFFLYGMGERPEALTLGSLVLEKYWQPMIARHYTHELLRYSLIAPARETKLKLDLVARKHCVNTPTLPI